MYYLVIIYGGTDPERFGDYATREDVVEEAKTARISEEDGLFYMTIESGIPTLNSFTNDDLA